MVAMPMMMNVQSELHMTAGDGETSYAKNSRIQEKAMVETKPVLYKVTREVYTTLLPRRMVIVDLGCSSGPNTLRFVSEVINTIARARHCSEFDRRGDNVELQFFLNDLPANDFNNLFRYFEQFKKLMAQNHMGEALPAYYISGSPGSFYARLFPSQTVHLFHSLFCLQWRSQAPKGLERARKTLLDGDIYITATSSPSIVKLFQKQFQNDLSLFLNLRCEELVIGGQMVLTFVGRKIEDVHSGEPNHFYGLLAQSLRSLVDKGLVEKEKLESFYLPIYSPSVHEVNEVVKKNGSFNVNHIQLFELNWDPYDDSEGNVIHDSVQSGTNVATCIRAVMESVVASHFGDTITDTLFTEYAHRAAKHLKKDKTKHAVIIHTMKKVC